MRNSGVPKISDGQEPCPASSLEAKLRMPNPETATRDRQPANFRPEAGGGEQRQQADGCDRHDWDEDSHSSGQPNGGFERYDAIRKGPCAAPQAKGVESFLEIPGRCQLAGAAYSMVEARPTSRTIAAVTANRTSLRKDASLHFANLSSASEVNPSSPPIPRPAVKFDVA